ncbi:MAG: SDR family NAD(P)-dependent oxidoreductase [Rhodobacteraceae bacterium]|nr:SDR family NAD(P)-dependent oxidoreductase [Paracoccaceae bacterium]
MLRRDVIAAIAATAAMTDAVPTAAQAPAPQSPTPQSPTGVPRKAVLTYPNKTMSAKDAVALVTGSNRGVGLGFVKVLLARGAKRVYATARNPEHFAELAALDPGRVVPLELDVTNDAHRRAAAEAATDLTWLINNAAYPGGRNTEERRILSATNLDDLKRSMDTNCWAPAELARLFAPIILKNGGGVIANILTAGAWYCLPEYSGYSISKAAEMMATQGLRAELDREPILVASVFTGDVDTRATPVGHTGNFTPEQHAEEVLDAVARGESDIYAAGSYGMRARIDEDPAAFHRRVIDRFHDRPLVIKNHI